MLINGGFQENLIPNVALLPQTPSGWLAGEEGRIEIWNPLAYWAGRFDSGRTGLSINDFVLALSSGASVRQTLAGVDPANAPIIDVNFTIFDRYAASGEVTVKIGDREYFAGENTWITLATPGNPPFNVLGRPFEVNFRIDLSEIPNFRSLTGPVELVVRNASGLQVNIDNITADFRNTICIGSGALIAVENGNCPIENLKIGDLIQTGSGELSPIVKIFKRKIDLHNASATSKLRPIKITAGALGNDLPKEDLLVSQQHRMLISSVISERMFGTKNALVPAIKLIKVPGIHIDKSIKFVEYFHLLFNKHEVIFANSAPTESLYTGKEALKSISAAFREEIFAIFPEMKKINFTPKPVHLIPSNKMQKKIISRHIKNKKPLLDKYANPHISHSILQQKTSEPKIN